MKRSIGVILSAVIGFIGSGVCLLFAVFMGFAAVAPHPLPPSSPAIRPVPTPTTALLVFALFYVAFAAWGIVSSIGLLRLRRWARICFLIFAGLLTVFASFGVVGCISAMLLAPKMLPPGQQVPPGILMGIFLFFLLCALAFAALGVGWLFYFNRNTVKSQFQDEHSVPLPGALPLSIAVIAWIQVVAGLPFPLVFFTTYPMILLGFVVHGWTARITFALLALISLTAGIGLLRKRTQAHSLAVGYQVFTLLNGVALIASSATWTIMTEQISQNPALNMDLIHPFVRLGLVFGLIFPIVALWFLLTRRQAFLSACRG